MSAAAASVITRPTFTLADRLKIQQESCRNKSYQIIGRLTTVVWEAQRNTSGLSQSRARYMNSKQAEHIPDALKPFSETQTKLWNSITLDWLNHKNAPTLAISMDRQDLLLPLGLTPLPPIPDPRWMPKHAQHSCPKSVLKGCAGCVPPRIAQSLTGCPVVGDRVQDKITARDGKVLGVIHPITEMCVMLSGRGNGGFGRIRGGVDPADGTHLALLIDDEFNAWFVGGKFIFGG